jgi:vancomycin resistance protein YoaR
MTPRLLMLPLLLLLSVAGPAEELARFSCQRPEPVEQGSATNAAIACELVNGVVLQPGEAFSFNHAMGAGLDRFVEGTAYSSGKVIKSEGGGVCQVSAALYNAALLAGLEVLERHSHSLYDPATAYVPAGRDSAISRSVGADMRFRNSTAAPLTLSVTAQGGKVEAVLLGHQRHQRKRWIVTQELEREAHGRRLRDDAALAPGQQVQQQEGFDGLRIKRQLCKEAVDGQSECESLGVDEYMKVDEVWLQGPPSAGSGQTPSASSGQVQATIPSKEQP